MKAETKIIGLITTSINGKIIKQEPILETKLVEPKWKRIIKDRSNWVYFIIFLVSGCLITFHPKYTITYAFMSGYFWCRLLDKIEKS